MSNEHTNVGAGLEGTSSPNTNENRKKGLLRRLGDSISHNKNALMVAGGLAVGTSALPAVQGCAFETGGNQEKTGTSQSALLSNWSEGKTGQYNIDPSTTIKGDMKYRTFISDRDGSHQAYVSKFNDTNNCPNTWCPAELINTPSGIPVNFYPAGTTSVRYYEYQGNGRLMASIDYDGSPDIYQFDYDLVNNIASNGTKITQISQDYRAEDEIEISADGTLMLYAITQGGSDLDIYQVDLPGFTNSMVVTGLNTASYEGAPFFFGSEDKIAFSSNRAGSAYLGTNVFVANNYNRATHSVGAIVPVESLNSNLNDGTGDTDSNGETCISVETAPVDGGPHQWVINCDPTLPGPSLPDGGAGGAGGSAGAGGSGGVDAGGAAGTAGTGGVSEGGAGAGGIGGTAGSGGSAGTGGTINTGGTAGTGGVAGAPNGGSGGVAGAPNGGSGGVAGSETGGTGGVAGAPNGGSGGVAGAPNGGSGGVAGSAGEGGKAGAGGTAGEGGTPECPIKVEGVNCTITDCDKYEAGGVVTLNTVNDCTYTDPLNDTFHITGTGKSFLDHYMLTNPQTVKVAATHPSGNPKVDIGFQTDNGTNVNAGTLGTIYDMSMEVRDNIKGFLVHVTESASDVKACDSNNQNCVAVNLFDMGAGPGIVTQGNSQFMSFSDLDALVAPVVQPDAGPNITPPAEGDGGGCNVHGQSPEGINGYTFGLLLALGLVARRKENE